MSGRRDPWLDLLRVACLGMVVLYHSTFIGPLLYPWLAPRRLVFAHQVGASLLLVLSAYLAAASLSDSRRATARWWFSRTARLLPGFAAGTVAAWAALCWLAPSGMYRPGVFDLLTNLAMLWNWNGAHHWNYVDASYWTLPIQLAAFALAPRLRRSRCGRGPRLRVLLWVAVLVPLAQWPLAQKAGPVYDSVVDGLALYRWHLLVAGVAAWMLSTGRLRPGPAFALLTVCVAAHAIQNGSWPPGRGLVTDPWSVLGVALGLAALLLGARARDAGLHPPAPLAGLARRLAANSYGIYLVHQTLGYVLMLRLQQLFGVGAGLQTVAMLTQALVLGTALTHLVEHPAHRALLRAWDAHGARSPNLQGAPVRLVIPPRTPRIRAGGAAAS